MKNILLVAIALLTVAVVFLFVKVYSKDAPKKSVISTSASSTTTHAGPLLAYVELDSLYEKISFIRNMRDQLEKEQKNIEDEWAGSMKGLEIRRDNFIKTNGNNITQELAEQFQSKLIQDQQTIEAKKQNLANKLGEKSYKFMEDVQGKMKTFLADYNKEKGFSYILSTGTGLDYILYKDSALNITDDVISGLNEVFTKK